MENLTPIEVLAKTTEEALRSKNAEFLAKYPTDEDQINHYTDLAMEVFKKFDIDGTFTRKGVRKNVETWFENKKAQMELFRKHPYWNEEAKAIVFSHTENREINYSTARHCLGDILIYSREKINDDHYDNFLMAIYNALDWSGDNTGLLTDVFIERIGREVNITKIDKSLKRILKSGTKITKLVRAACTKWCTGNNKVVDVTTLADEHEDGDRDYRSFEKYYARFADSLSELAIKRITMVSLHFCDFMLMSNGNSWLSCHYINSNNIFHDRNCSSYSGSSKQGCLSYALDEPSFIFYTLPSTYDGEDYYLQQKINRMCCQYKNGILVTGKCYPNNEDSYITRYRQTMQYIISSIENIPNSWTFSRNVNRITGLVTTADNAYHYRDYEYSGQKPTISMCKNFSMGDIDDLMVIGHEAYCLDCGERIGWDAGWLQCSRHRIKPVCKRCGCYIEDESKRHVYDGEMYCDDCVFYCDYHKEYESLSDNMCILEMKDGTTIKVCEHAQYHYYKQCESCGKWVLKCDATRFRGKYYCNECCQIIIDDVQERTSRIGLEIVPQGSYKEGDYVLVVDDVSICECGYNEEMQRDYASRIAKITSVNDGSYYSSDGYSYKITIEHDAYGRWSWTTNCFVGKLYGDNLDDSIIGKYIDEV